MTGYTWQQKLQLSHENPSNVIVSETPVCRSEECPNNNYLAETSTTLPQISEHMSLILILKLNIGQTVFTSIWHGQMYSDGYNDIYPGLPGASRLRVFGHKSRNFAKYM
jgi:hypothetical protein